MAKSRKLLSRLELERDDTAATSDRIFQDIQSGLHKNTTSAATAVQLLHMFQAFEEGFQSLIDRHKMTMLYNEFLCETQDWIDAMPPFVSELPDFEIFSELES